MRKVREDGPDRICVLYSHLRERHFRRGRATVGGHLDTTGRRTGITSSLEKGTHNASNKADPGTDGMLCRRSSSAWPPAAPTTILRFGAEHPTSSVPCGAASTSAAEILRGCWPRPIRPSSRRSPSAPPDAPTRPSSTARRRPPHQAHLRTPRASPRCSRGWPPIRRLRAPR